MLFCSHNGNAEISPNDKQVKRDQLHVSELQQMQDKKQKKKTSLSI